MARTPSARSRVGRASKPYASAGSRENRKMFTGGHFGIEVPMSLRTTIPDDGDPRGEARVVLSVAAH